MSVEILVFQIAEQRYGIRSANVLEVIRAVTLSPFPGAPPAVEGILNLRGNVLPVLDLRRLLGLPCRPLQHTDHLVVVNSRSHSMAIRVDRALNLAQAEAAQRPQATEPMSKRVVDWVARNLDELVHVIDPDQLLSVDEMAPLFAALGDATAMEAAT